MQFQPGKIGRIAHYVTLLALLTGLSSTAWAGPDPVCGDGLCNKGEKPDSCPLDCGTDTSETAGNIFKADLGG